MDESVWSQEEIAALVTAVTTDNPFVLRDQEYEKRRDLLFQRRFVSIPGVTVDAKGNQRPSALQFRSPEIEDDAHAFKNRMLASPLKIKVAAVKKSQKAEEAAQRQEDFFYRHYYRWRDQGVFDGALFDQASLGIGWVHLSLNTELLPIVPDYDADDAEGFMRLAQDELEKFTTGEKSELFVLEHIDTNTMYWSPDGKIKIQKARVPLNPLVEKYGGMGVQVSVDDKENLSITTLTPGQNVMVYRSNWARQATLYTVETDDYCYHLVSSRVSTPTPAKEEFLMLGAYRNYFGTPCFFKVVGEKTGSSDPLYQYRPMLNGKYQTVPVKNILTTSMVTAGSEAAQQRYSVKWVGQGPPPDDDANVIVTLTEDGIFNLPPGYEIVSSNLTVGPDLPGALAHLEKIDMYGYPKALARPEEVAASSGYDRARQQDAVASLLDPPLAHFAAMMTDVFRAMLHAVVEIGVPITVRSTTTKATGGRGIVTLKEATLNPEDCKDDTDISVDFNSVTIFSRIAMQEEGMKLMQADQLTETQMQSDVMGTDDLEAWRDQRALDKVLKNADDRAVAAVNQAIDQLAQKVQEAAMAANGIQPPMTPPANGAMPGAISPTNGQMLRNDRGPGIPVGTGQSIPAVGPAPPAPAELGMPQVTPGAGP